MSLPANSRAILAEAGAGAPGARLDLGAVALALASADRPALAPEPYQRHLERLCSEVGAYAGGDEGLDVRLEALHQVLGRRWGYLGEDEMREEPDGGNLSRLIDRRQGTATVLGLLWIRIARGLGWEAEGLDFPGHFLIRLGGGGGGGRAIVDPAAAGRVLEIPDLRALVKARLGLDAELESSHHRAVDDIELPIKLANEAKFRYLKADRIADALGQVEASKLLEPAKAAPWREAGLLAARLERLDDAVENLEEYLRRETAEDARYRATQFLHELEQRRNEF